MSRLDPDEERAGVSFERLRRALIRFFDWRGASFPEECADETLDRLVKKLEEGVAVIDVTSFALGISRLVHLEAIRSDARREVLAFEPKASPPSDSHEKEEIARHLELCLAALAAQGRELILRYYAEDGGRSRIQSRERLARELRLSDNALRCRVQRLKNSLEDCLRMRIGQEATT